MTKLLYFLVGAIVHITSGKLNLDIYYESLCPDSTRFISRQVGPMHEAIGQDVEVTFVPYGFAETTEVDGGYEFECQHGPDECYGNMVQACTIAYSPNYETTVSLIVCMMSSSNPALAGPECFETLGVDFAPVQDCLDNGEGEALHAQNGEIQNSLNPRPNNVPWSNFDGEHLLEYWELEELGLKEYICSTFQLPSC